VSDKVEERNRKILDAAVELAGERGYRRVTRSDVADRAGVATGSVNNAYGTMDGLRDAIMSAAVTRQLAAIVAQGLADGHPAARAAPQTLKDSALASLAA
jgi:AcrR family transcriptional regulator